MSRNTDVSPLKQQVLDYVDQRGASADELLEVLHHLLRTYGDISPELMQIVADALNLSVAEVAGVVSFYDDFHAHGQLDVCGGEACQAMVGRGLLQALESEYPGGVREVFCLGNCGAAPSVRRGDTILGRAALTQVQQLMNADPVDAG